MKTLVLPQERHREILRRLAESGRVLAAGLAREFGTSEDTIRRDLRDLAEAGRCERVYGGAILLSPATGSLRERLSEAPARKAALARTASALVRAGQVVFIDTGSTNLAIAHALPQDVPLTVATNAPAVAAALGERERTEIIVIGGRLDRRLGGTTGAAAVAGVRQIRADLCFIGTCAVEVELGIGACDAEEAMLKRAIVEASASCVVAVLADKLGTRAPFFVAPASAIHHLVVEAGTARERTAPLASSGVTIHEAGAAADD
jgi:DeoR/GlpR family transcriptional regulator of sugar metabolism